MLERGACLLILILQSACVPLLFDDSCGPAMRFTSVQGDIREGATVLGTAHAELAEQRGGPYRLHAVVMGPRTDSQGGPLKGHVTRARLVHAESGATLSELSEKPGLGPEMLESTIIHLDVRAMDGLKRVFKDGDAVLDLETDLPGRERFIAPLPLVSAGGWTRASCS